MPPINAQGAGGLYERLVSTKPQGASKYRSMRQDLAVFDAADLYEYACPTGVRDPREAENEALLARAEERVKDYMRNTSERSAAERLCSRAREVFVDDVQRRRYDEFLQWCDLKAVFDDLGGRMSPAATRCSSEDVAQEIVRLNQLLGSRSQAEALMESYLAGRGVEYVDARFAAADHGARRQAEDETVALEGAMPRKQAGARHGAQASPVSALPDSALRPSTPDPAAQARAQVQGGYGAAGQQVRAGAQAGFGYGYGAHQGAAAQGAMRRCSCGAMNDADQNFCQACGRPLGGAAGAMGATSVMAAPAPARTPAPYQPRDYRRQQSAPAEKRFPVAPIVAVVLVALVLAGAAAYLVINGAPDLGSGTAETEQSADSAAQRGTKRITSGSVKAVSCTPKTIIIPLDSDEQPLEYYEVKLTHKTSGIAVDAFLHVKGVGGFTLANFNESGKSTEEIASDTYEVTMTDTSSNTVCTFTMEYDALGSGNTKIVEIKAAG